MRIGKLFFAYKTQALRAGACANVYVADSQAGLFYKVTPDGTQATVGSGFYMPMSVAVDKAGNVYAADPWNGFVAKITPDGAQTTLGGGYNSPVGVAVDRAGNVYVADVQLCGVQDCAGRNADHFGRRPGGSSVCGGRPLGRSLRHRHRHQFTGLRPWVDMSLSELGMHELKRHNLASFHPPRVR